MTTISVGDTGRIIRVNADFILTANTELTMNFIKPDNSIVSKTRTSGEVSVGTVDVVDPDQGLMLAFEYAIYITEVGFLDQYGSPWIVCLIYDDITTSPPQSFSGTDFEFEVEKRCGDPS